MTSSVSPRSELPASALLESEGKTRVWIVDPQQKTVATRDVKLLERTPGTVVLASGVQAGERVVTAGVNSLKPGQKVIVDEEDPQ
ncbi:multidrug efflux system subunit MdtA [compost metagenome]